MLCDGLEGWDVGWGRREALEGGYTCIRIGEGDKSWVFIGRTDSDAETPILWPPHAKS